MTSLQTLVSLLGLVLWAGGPSTGLFLPESPELRQLLSRYQEEETDQNSTGGDGGRARRAIRWSDREEILQMHNRLRGGVYPTASNMEYMVRSGTFQNKSVFSVCLETLDPIDNVRGWRR